MKEPGQPLIPGTGVQVVTRPSILLQHTGQLTLDQLSKERSLILETLEIKKLGGSVVAEKVSCGKQSCSKCRGFQRTHGPYLYLHFYDSSCPWKVRKRYLGKALGMLCCHKTEELKHRLREIDRLLVTSKDKGRKETSQTSAVLEQQTVLSVPLWPREYSALKRLANPKPATELGQKIIRQWLGRQPPLRGVEKGEG